MRHVPGSGIYPGDNGKTWKDFEQGCDMIIFAVEKNHSWWLCGEYGKNFAKGLVGATDTGMEELK